MTENRGIHNQQTETWPQDGKYVLRTRTVEAKYYDGTTARAYEILGWVHRNNHGGSYERRDNSYSDNAVLTIEGYEPNPFVWVVLEGKDFVYYNDEDFKEKYKNANDPVYR